MILVIKFARCKTKVKCNCAQHVSANKVFHQLKYSIKSMPIGQVLLCQKTLCDILYTYIKNQLPCVSLGRMRKWLDRFDYTFYFVLFAEANWDGLGKKKIIRNPRGRNRGHSWCLYLKKLNTIIIISIYTTESQSLISASLLSGIDSVVAPIQLISIKVHYVNIIFSVQELTSSDKRHLY